MTSPSKAERWIAQLGLRPHPEGGAFVETYRSPDLLARAGLPERFPGPRPASTAILFLLRQGEISHLHRLRSDEVWHFHAGAPLLVHVILPGGELRRHRLGPHPEHGEVFQAAVPHGAWFGAELAGPGEFALVGCTVSPGFDFADFELADRATLLWEFPQHADLIARLAADTLT
ncbi:MAG: cupin domain-containing protein [Acidobacteriota bacterium]